MCKVELGYHDGVQLDAVWKAWVGGCWLSAWTDTNGLIGNYLVCAAYEHAVWVVLSDGGGLRHGPSLPKRVETCCVRY